MAFSILKALEEIHKQKIVHGAINLDNVVCSSKNIENPNCQFKLINFENARMLPTKKLPAIFNERHLNSPFVAPEVANKNAIKFGPAADIWSFGMLIYTLITGNEPKPKKLAKTVQEARSEFEEGNKLLHGRLQNLFSAACKEFLEQCLQKAPESRFSATNLLAKPWV